MKPGFIGKISEYAQFPAKLACLLPFVLALLYSGHLYHQISAFKTIVFFISMFSFDLSVTALNNYMDSKSDGAPLPFGRAAALRILIVLWLIGGIGAAILVYDDGLVVLGLGGICVVVGILYSFGPAPISRMPLGEVFSGIFEGFFIPFLVVYINSPIQSLVWYELHTMILQVGFNLINLFNLAVLSVPAILGIADIMLANNICDVESDVKVRRYTLPYYIGSKNAVRLFSLIYIAAYADVIALALFGILPPYVLVVLPGLAAVQFNIRKFRAFQSKKETFPLSIVNFLILMVPLILVTAAAALK